MRLRRAVHCGEGRAGTPDRRASTAASDVAYGAFRKPLVLEMTASLRKGMAARKDTSRSTHTRADAQSAGRIVSTTSEVSPKTAADRAFRVLRTLDALGPGTHSLDTLTRLTGLARSTAHRILQSAVREGAVLQSGYGRYRLAPSAVSPVTGPLVNLPFSLETLHTELSALRSRAGDAALIHVPVMLRPPLRVSLCCCYDPGGELAPSFADGDRSGPLFRAPLYTDAAGLVLLARLPGVAPGDPVLRRIRDLNHARTPSALPGWDLVAAPVQRGAATVASVSLLVRRSTDPGPHRRAAAEVMRTVARLGQAARCTSRPAGAGRAR
ncbi:helix-turn-helix domain-containing protein [Streptomyces antimycoticus]|uniref:helix-turn-helix domain-containing protein n=1 Tax=Streptomyces antimycoticus TaxID=68175 RepID=UPI0010F564CF|nr:helix-turn-helix domain-containing protein [Streptomyces antimycoticus]